MKLSALAFVLCCASGLVLAQGSPSPSGGPPDPGHRLERLAILLDLTDTQKAQVKSVLDAEHAKVRAQMQSARAAGSKPSFEQIQAARQQIRAETLQQLTPVLSATQLKKFQALMESERGPGGPGHGPHDSTTPSPPPAPN